MRKRDQLLRSGSAVMNVDPASRFFGKTGVITQVNYNAHRSSYYIVIQGSEYDHGFIEVRSRPDQVRRASQNPVEARS